MVLWGGIWGRPILFRAQISLYNIRDNELRKRKLIWSLIVLTRPVRAFNNSGLRGFLILCFSNVPHSWVSGFTQQAIAELIGNPR